MCSGLGVSIDVKTTQIKIDFGKNEIAFVSAVTNQSYLKVCFLYVCVVLHCVCLQ